MLDKLLNHEICKRNLHTEVKLQTLFVPWSPDEDFDQNDQLQNYLKDTNYEYKCALDPTNKKISCLNIVTKHTLDISYSNLCSFEILQAHQSRLMGIQRQVSE